jgi:Uma2 family endonuclease
MNINKPEFQFERMSLDDFEELLLDKPENEKWELIGGRVIRGMVGARIEHQRIVRNIDNALTNHFRTTGRACESLRETFWLKKHVLELGVFPDIMVHCGKIEPGSVSIDDPLILFEVVSQGSEARDRLEKKDLYLKLPSLQHYVLVKRDRAYVDVFDRGATGWTGYRELDGLSAVLALPKIGLEIPLAEIYRDVIVPPAT